MTEPIAEFTDYEGLRQALRTAQDYRNISLEDLDKFGGGPDGLFGKILGPRAVKRLGLQSLGWVLGGLGIRAILVEDPEAWQRIVERKDFKARDKAHLASVRQMHASAVHLILSRKDVARNAAKGGKARWANLTPKQRSKLAKKIAKSRWRKVKRRRAK